MSSRQTQDSKSNMNAIDIIRPKDILLSATAASKTALLQWLAQKAADSVGIDAAAVYESLRKREELGSTGIGNGIAMPHAPIAGLECPFGLIAQMEAPVPFDAIDEKPVDIVCLLLTPGHLGKEHINVLACVARRLHISDVQRRIRQAKSIAEIYDALGGPS